MSQEQELMPFIVCLYIDVCLSMMPVESLNVCHLFSAFNLMSVYELYLVYNILLPLLMFACLMHDVRLFIAICL